MNDSVVRRYRDIAEISGRMVNEALNNQWDQVLALSEQYADAVERLRQVNDMNDADRKARRELLVRILDDDAHIRLLAAPELDRLGSKLGQLNKGRQMLSAYRKQSTLPDSNHGLREASFNARP